KNRVIADHAIVSHMCGSHEEIIASNASHAPALNGSPAHRNAFAEDVAIANLQVRALTRILQILRIAANSAKRMQHVAAAQARRTIHYSVRMKNAILAQLDVVAHDCIGPDRDSRAQSRAGRNYRAGVDFGWSCGAI